MNEQDTPDWFDRFARGAVHQRVSQEFDHQLKSWIRDYIDERAEEIAFEALESVLEEADSETLEEQVRESISEYSKSRVDKIVRDEIDDQLEHEVSVQLASFNIESRVRDEVDGALDVEISEAVQNREREIGEEIERRAENVKEETVDDFDEILEQKVKNAERRIHELGVRHEGQIRSAVDSERDDMIDMVVDEIKEDVLENSNEVAIEALENLFVGEIQEGFIGEVIRARARAEVRGAVDDMGVESQLDTKQTTLNSFRNPDQQVEIPMAVSQGSYVRYVHNGDIVGFDNPDEVPSLGTRVIIGGTEWKVTSERRMFDGDELDYYRLEVEPT